MLCTHYSSCAQANYFCAPPTICRLCFLRRPFSLFPRISATMDRRAVILPFLLAIIAFSYRFEPVHAVPPCYYTNDCAWRAFNYAPSSAKSIDAEQMAAEIAKRQMKSPIMGAALPPWFSMPNRHDLVAFKKKREGDELGARWAMMDLMHGDYMTPLKEDIASDWMVQRHFHSNDD